VSWFDPAWKFRASVTIDNTAGSSGSNDWALTLPGSWDHFWDNTLANGYDTVLTAEDGTTKSVFERQSWTHATQTGALRVDGHTLSTAEAHHAFIYYGNAAAAVDPVAAVSISSALSAYLDLTDPRRAWPIIRARPERPGRTAPSPQISKASTETIRVWWDLGRALERRATESNGKKALEEVTYAGFGIFDGANPQAGMIDETETRIVDGRYVMTLIKAGTTATDYTPRLTIGTTAGRVLDYRALLQVRDTNED